MLRATIVGFLVGVVVGSALHPLGAAGFAVAVSLGTLFGAGLMGE